MPKPSAADIAVLSTPGTKPTSAGNLVLVVKEGQCGCGCAGTPTGKARNFRQGHDASLRSKLTKAFQAGVKVELVTDKGRTTFEPSTMAKEHGWVLSDKPRASRAKSPAKAKAKSGAKRKVRRKTAA